MGNQLITKPSLYGQVLLLLNIHTVGSRYQCHAQSKCQVLPNTAYQYCESQDVPVSYVTVCHSRLCLSSLDLSPCTWEVVQGDAMWALCLAACYVWLWECISRWILFLWTLGPVLQRIVLWVTIHCKAGICECLNANCKQLLHCTKLCIYLCVWVGTLKIARQKIVLVV